MPGYSERDSSIANSGQPRRRAAVVEAATTALTTIVIQQVMTMLMTMLIALLIDGYGDVR